MATPAAGHVWIVGADQPATSPWPGAQACTFRPAGSPFPPSVKFTECRVVPWCHGRVVPVSGLGKSPCVSQVGADATAASSTAIFDPVHIDSYSRKLAGGMVLQPPSYANNSVKGAVPGCPAGGYCPRWLELAAGTEANGTAFIHTHNLGERVRDAGVAVLAKKVAVDLLLIARKRPAAERLLLSALEAEREAVRLATEAGRPL